MKTSLETLVAGVLLASVAAASLHAAPKAGPEDPTFPGVKLPKPATGTAAIRALGPQLPGVAKAYGITGGQLDLLLRTDRSLTVDRAGRLFYVCEGPAESGTAGTGSTEPVSALVPASQTFTLHSRPGAPLVIYLDFDGHVTSGTAWNNNFNGGADFATPPYTIDGDPAFSSTELDRIQYIWQRVAEDFAPFDVDVTTEDPGADNLRRSGTGDTRWGVRVCIGGSSSDWYGASAGGVAYLGSFTSSLDTPCYVFTAQLGTGNEKYTAEAASHEAGHTFNLRHDGTSTVGYYEGHGTGTTGWAPIMGVGYYKNLVQWSKGEYSGANNTQDDVAGIAGYVGYRPDDHGNTPATASHFPAGTTLSGQGIIGTATDVDVFAFTTGSGAVSLTVTPDSRSANLDVVAELRDAGGTLIASSNPVDSLGASFGLNLAGGTYHLSVRGTGKGNPATDGYSTYGSLGQYTVTGSVTAPGPVAPVAVISATPTSGDAPLVVSFSGSGSFDGDGSVVAHAWNFGDGTLASGATVSHVYGAAGDYTAVLTVTDNSGLTGSSSTLIRVLAPNQPPVAVASATPTSGDAPLVVAFDAAGSVDPDGILTGYAWAFGDGSTGSGPTVSHTYSSPGSYTAVLTVTDDRGATDSASVVISATQPPAVGMRLAALGLTVVPAGRGSAVEASVRVTGLDGQPVAGATVSGTWSGLVSGSGSAITDSNGLAVLLSKSTRSSGTITFTVGSVTRSGFTYSSADNLVSSTASIQVGSTGGGGGGGGGKGGKR